MDNVGLKIGHNSASRNLELQTNSTTRMTIDPAGRVGIGTTSPQASLHVQVHSPNNEVRISKSGGDQNLRLDPDGRQTNQFLILDHQAGDSLAVSARWNGHFIESASSSKALYIGAGSRNTDIVVYHTGDIALGANGRVGIGTSSPSHKLTVDGSICYQGSVCMSDMRYKRDIEPLQGGLNLVSALRPVRYYWDRERHPERHYDDGRQIGFVAQEVECVLPEVVSVGADGYYAMDYERLTPVLVGAVQELSAAAESRDAEINQLRDENRRLRAELDELRAMVVEIQSARR